MFSSWFSSPSSPPGDNDTDPEAASHEPLTPLPPKLHLRAPSTPSVLHASPPSSPTATAAEGGEPATRFEGRSFAELLSRDPRESVLMHEGEGCDAGGATDTSRAGVARENSMLVLPGGEFAVVGPDASLLLQELHRLRTFTAQKTRRRTAHVAGALSLVVLAVTGWFLVEACGALVKSGGKGRGKERWVEMGFLLAVLALWVVVFAFLRARRLSPLSLLGLLSAALIAFLHLSLALTNLVLAFVWKVELSQRCDWGVGAAWTMGAKGEVCGEGEGVGGKGWAAAAGVRLVVTVLFLALWLFTLRRYNVALHTPLRISPSALPSSELRSLLERHRADIVPLSSSAHAHPQPLGEGEGDALPAMPERAAHYALVSEGEESRMWSYRGSEVSRVSSTMRRGEKTSEQGGVGAWMGAKVWGGVGWLFGVRPHEQAAAGGEDEEKALHGEGEKPLARSPRDEDEEASFVGAPPAPSIPSRPSYAASWLSPERRDSDDSSPSSDYRSLFSGLRRPPSTSSFSFSSSSRSDKRHSTGTVASCAPLLERPLPPAAVEEDDPEEPALPAPPPPPKDAPPVHPHSHTHGSSGSSQGAIVYVRMSDGRLVRRLSTIASVSEAGYSHSSPSSPARGMSRSRSDLTGHSMSGSGSGRSGSESFATAAEVFAHHQQGGGDGEEEVLIVEDGTGEVVEEWRRRNE
ncbi:hypothetical protein JCM6882_007300 [Rhodosporidiobolus microsporus]